MPIAPVAAYAAPTQSPPAEPPSAAPAPPASNWQSQSWWDADDEPDDWLEAEALIEREQARQAARRQAEARGTERSNLKEEIEDRE